MIVHVTINGFGRTGCNAVRALYESKHYMGATVVAIGELADTMDMAYLSKYDTNHSRLV